MGDFSLSGGVEIIGFISPTDTTDTYPVIDTLYGIDGLRNVDNLTQLNAIPNQRRRSGMLVGVSGGAQYYKLNSPPWSGTTDDWSIFTTDGGTFTGNTSGDCIVDLYITNLHGCSPITIDGSMQYSGSTAFTQSLAIGNASYAGQDEISSIVTSAITINSNYWGLDAVVISGNHQAEWADYITNAPNGSVSLSLAGGSTPETYVINDSTYDVGNVETVLFDLNGFTSPSFSDHTTLSATAVTQRKLIGFAMGDNVTSSGYTSFVVGEDSTVSGDHSFVSGLRNAVSVSRAATFGILNTVSGVNSFVVNANNTVSGSNSLVGGTSNVIESDGDKSFCHGNQHRISSSLTSAIVGGNNNVINGGNRSVILGGQNITGTTDDTVYVPNLNLCEFGGTLYTSSISGCSPITIGEANFPQGITVSGESVSTENQTEIFSTQSFNISMDTGTTSNEIGNLLIANFKHPSGVIITNSIRFRPSDVTSRDIITYGTESIVHADYGTVDVAGLGLGPTETIGLTGLTYGTTTVSVGWNGISFSGTVTVIGG